LTNCNLRPWVASLQPIQHVRNSCPLEYGGRPCFRISVERSRMRPWPRKTLKRLKLKKLTLCDLFTLLVYVLPLLDAGRPQQSRDPCEETPVLFLKEVHRAVHLAMN
jgi:hypothetical protein